MSQLMGRLRQFDAYSKPLEDFRVKTLSGGAVTLISGVIMVLLFISELRLYLRTEIVEELFVDSSALEDTVEVKFDLTFHALACSFVTVDAMDISGEHQSDVTHNVWKVRVDKDGKEISDTPEKQELNKPSEDTKLTTDKPETAECRSCYGAETADRKCCQTCEEVKEQYRKKGWALRDIELVEQCKSESWVKKLEQSQGEGCKVSGSVAVSKVAGNFHIAPGETLKDRHSHVHDLHALGPHKFNTSHTVRHLSFGKHYPGKEYPLDGHNSQAETGGTMFQYFVKIVPTMYVSETEDSIMTHQFSVTKHRKLIQPGAGDGLPGFFIQYEFSPLMVKLSERHQSLTHFLVSVCAIIGGVFTVASLIDSFIYHSSKILKQKVDLGKAG